eukprot:jgi/Psemu1/286085/fgenesh1_pg.120_\
MAFRYIVDEGAEPTRVWLTRHKLHDDKVVNSEKWRPLRTEDIKALNKRNGAREVFIEEKRKIAHPENNIITTSFKAIRRPVQELTSCTWFVVEQENGNDPQLTPMPDEDAEVAEQMYQKLAAALRKGKHSEVNAIMNKREDLENGGYLVVEFSGEYEIKKQPGNLPLQRGHGCLKKEEVKLGPVNHVVFVVHGIGEAWFSRDTMPSMVEQMDKFRVTFRERQIAHWKKERDVARENGKQVPTPPNRVEFLPVIWYDGVHNDSYSMRNTLTSVTLNGIPTMRSLANDIVVDVLLYLSPKHCHKVLVTTTKQIIELKERFNELFPTFESGEQGKYSLIGHSLGSIICWDLLSLKKLSNDSKVEPGKWSPELPEPIKEVLPFEPNCTMFMGSPIGLFLSLRGAHDDFESIPNKDHNPKKPKISPFKLPSGAIYNIFSNDDPVAYRIEPLLLNQGTKKEDIPEPKDLRKGTGKGLINMATGIASTAANSLTSTMSYLFGAASESASNRATETPTVTSGDDSDERNRPDQEGEQWAFPLSGKSGRLDYKLQHEITFPPVTALTAHSNYFEEPDVAEFVIDALNRQPDALNRLPEQ